MSLAEKGWDQGIFSVIGSACGAGKLLGLSGERMAHAISLALVPNLPLGQTRVGELSMWKGCATAAAARNGVFAALLAWEGMEGPYEPFEGRHGLWEQATGPLGSEAFGPSAGPTTAGDGRAFKISETSLKYFPSQIHTQAPISIALELRKEVDVGDIEAINLETYQTAWRSAGSEPEKWDPKTRETADHSLPYLIAVAFRDGAITPASFTEECVRDPDLRPLMRRVAIRENPEFTRQYPEAQLARIEVVTRSGGRLVQQASYPKGHPKNPLTDGELEQKFQGLSQDVLTPGQGREALKTLWKLEEVGDIGEVLDLFGA